jgi:hypothetical protein
MKRSTPLFYLTAFSLATLPNLAFSATTSAHKLLILPTPHLIVPQQSHTHTFQHNAETNHQIKESTKTRTYNSKHDKPYVSMKNNNKTIQPKKINDKKHMNKPVNKNFNTTKGRNHKIVLAANITNNHHKSEHQSVPANGQTPTSLTNNLVPAPNMAQSIIRINDCLLVATIHIGNWNVECIRSGSTDKESWDKSSWQVTPMTKAAVPKDVWPVCTWLNGFGYEQLITTPDLGIDRRLGNISRRKNVYMYEHGYEVSGGMTLIGRLGKYCPAYGKNVHAAPKKTKSWTDYIPL